MEPTEDEITNLQQKALEQVESSDSTLYHAKDVEKLKSDRQWVRRFLIHHDLDKDKAFNMLMDTLKWRQKFGANDINHTNINLQIVCSGSMFPCSKDKDDKPMFIFKAKNTVKGTYKSEDMQKVLVYWFDRLEKQTKGDKFSIFFEMTGAGISNFDLEFVQYLIGLFRDYYPDLVNYIIVFEMSWILNAAWKIVKNMMPSKAVSFVKFVGRSDLKDLVPPSEQLVEWGGEKSYHFVFEPEFLPAAGPTTINGQFDDARKKVTFAEGTTSNDSSPVESTDPIKKLYPGQLLQLTPAEEIVFRREDGETTGLLTMTNTATCNVAYKIKTTSPDKYRVRPSAGVINAGAALNITVHIQSGYSASQLVRDKFLVMACAIDSDTLTNQQLIEVWKKTSEIAVQQHRLRCSVAPSDAKDEEFSGSISNSAALKLLQEMDPKLESILNEQQRLRSQMKQMRLLVLITVVLSIMLAFFFSRPSSQYEFIDNGSCST